MKHLELERHPRWPLYKKLRRALARELEITRNELRVTGGVTEHDVDDYMRVHSKEILKTIEKLFRADMEVREARLLEDTLATLNRHAWGKEDEPTTG